MLLNYKKGSDVASKFARIVDLNTIGMPWLLTAAIFCCFVLFW